MRYIQYGDPVEVRNRDGSTAQAVCAGALRSEAPMIRVSFANLLGLSFWERKLHHDADGTPWVHEYAEDETLPEGDPCPDCKTRMEYAHGVSRCFACGYSECG